jgi:hypothetical protein
MYLHYSDPTTLLDEERYTAQWGNCEGISALWTEHGQMNDDYYSFTGGRTVAKHVNEE